MSRRAAAFTLVELVVIILIIAVLALYATSRFSISPFQEAGFAQQAVAAVRYAQQLAISSGCDVEASVTATTCTVTWNDCGAGSPANGTSVSNPATGLNDFCANSEAASVTGDTVIFNSVGRPDAAATITIGAQTIEVEAETGYIH